MEHSKNTLVKFDQFQVNIHHLHNTGYKFYKSRG